MLAALLVVICWSIASVAGARASAHADAVPVTRVRLVVAIIILAGLLAIDGMVHWQRGGWWFLASGVCGMALGDTALFIAYQRMGARVPALVAYGMSVPLAAVGEWLCLGTQVDRLDLMGVLVLVSGVTLSLADAPALPAHGRRWTGVAWSMLAAGGFAASAILIRIGHRWWTVHPATVPGADIAVVRALGGLIAVVAVRAIMGRPSQDVEYWLGRFHRRQGAPHWVRASPWILLSAVAGPVVGVILYQRALAEVPSVLVQAMVTLVPVAVIPMTWWIEGDRPRLRAVLGAAIAAGAAAGIALRHR